MAKLRWKKKITRSWRLASRGIRQRRKRNPKWRGKQLHPRYMSYWVAVFDLQERRARKIIWQESGE